MSNGELDPEEQQILDEVERGEWVSVLTPERREELRMAAENTILAFESIDVKISSQDLESLQQQAKKVGLPSEFLASNILHQYLMGRLVVSAADEVGGSPD